MEEIPIPDKNNILVQYDMGNNSIPFYIPIDRYPPYASVRFACDIVAQGH